MAGWEVFSCQKLFSDHLGKRCFAIEPDRSTEHVILNAPKVDLFMSLAPFLIFSELFYLFEKLYSLMNDGGKAFGRVVDQDPGNLFFDLLSDPVGEFLQKTLCLT